MSNYKTTFDNISETVSKALEFDQQSSKHNMFRIYIQITRLMCSKVRLEKPDFIRHPSVFIFNFKRSSH